MKNLGRPPLIAVIVLLASCATTAFPPSAFPPRKTSDDCLVLIRTTIANKDNVPTAREYHFKLSSGNATITAPDDNDGFMFVFVREPGVKIVGLTSEVNKYLFSGNSLDEPLEVDLPYKHGEVVVADFTFVQTLEKLDEYHFISSFDFQKTSDESKAALIEKFRKKDGAKSWL
jgi:hypothetical protein